MLNKSVLFCALTILGTIHQTVLVFDIKNLYKTGKSTTQCYFHKENFSCVPRHVNIRSHTTNLVQTKK